MAERYDVRVKVISKIGNCNKHSVGDEFLVGRLTPAGMCTSAFHTLFPAARVLMFGGTYPWSKDPDTAIIGCPDAGRQVVFELRRIREAVDNKLKINAP